MAKTKRVNGNGPKDVSKKTKNQKKQAKPVPQKEVLVDTTGAYTQKKPDIRKPYPKDEVVLKKKAPEKFEEIRKAKINKSLQEHDSFYEKYHKQISDLKKKGQSIPEIARLFEKELDSISRGIHMVYYVLNRDGIIKTKVEQRLLKRHEELKNGKASS